MCLKIPIASQIILKHAYSHAAMENPFEGSDGL